MVILDGRLLYYLLFSIFSVIVNHKRVVGENHLFLVFSSFLLLNFLFTKKLFDCVEEKIREREITFAERDNIKKIIKGYNF